MRATAISLGFMVLMIGGCGTATGEETGTTGTTAEATATTGEVGTTMVEPTSTGSTTGSTGESDTAPTSTPTSGTTSDTSGEASTGTTGEAIDCAAISEGPFTPTLYLSGFVGSEDLAFDGQGGLVLKRDGEIVSVRADQSETVLAQGLAQAYGTRYLADGRLLVALPNSGEVLAYDAMGQAAAFLDGLKSPNGLYPDLAGDVWITEFGGSNVLRVGADLSVKTIVTGADASSANGVVYDPQRQLLFYTKYLAGQIQRVVIDGQGEPGAPELVAAVGGAALDGLTLDACGNVYAMDQKNSRLYRVRLDDAGAAVGEPALLAEFPSNVANAQFGVGDGFDAQTLYVAGNPGDVYTVAVAVPGAAIVTVQ